MSKQIIDILAKNKVVISIIAILLVVIVVIVVLIVLRLGLFKRTPATPTELPCDLFKRRLEGLSPNMDPETKTVYKINEKYLFDGKFVDKKRDGGQEYESDLITRDTYNKYKVPKLPGYKTVSNIDITPSWEKFNTEYLYYSKILRTKYIDDVSKYVDQSRLSALKVKYTKMDGLMIEMEIPNKEITLDKYNDGSSFCFL